jgi:hypothetical protein
LRPEGTFGISPSFLGLSQSSGHVTHVLLTRSRLCPRPKSGSSLHLHVLGTPPAFVLSQDQTLREELLTESCQEIHLRGSCRRQSPPACRDGPGHVPGGIMPPSPRLVDMTRRSGAPMYTESSGKRDGFNLGTVRPRRYGRGRQCRTWTHLGHWLARCACC